MEEGPESGAVRWASGAETLESGAGGGWESDAGLRQQRQTTRPFQKSLATCHYTLYNADTRVIYPIGTYLFSMLSFLFTVFYFKLFRCIFIFADLFSIDAYVSLHWC